MPPLFFPLRWESTGEQWWYATPIDWAAANGFYDIVRELLHLDPNLLIKLTSLRRIRRLETVWDDEAQFEDVAKSRSYVARKLLLEGELKGGKNSLIRAGYGGWLLYTAASAGDMDFVMELLEKDPLLVFGEGEYGVTDILYAAARSKNCEAFKLLLDFALSLRCCPSPGEGTMEESSESEMEMPSAFRWEMMNRAIHCAARGGNLVIMTELIGDCPDVLIYRDAQGSTILHTAAARGQIEVVKNLVASFDIISSTDDQGNTSLHVAAYMGHLAVVEFLIHDSPSLTSLSNSHGDTFLHLAVAGFRTSGFRRLDRQIELMEHLIHVELMNVKEIINIRNNDGKTVLHVSVTKNVQCDLVELLMSVPSIDLNITDEDGLTPLDLLEQQPRSPSLEILIKRFVSAGGISSRRDNMATNAFVSHLKMQGIGSSPGTSFRVPDAEIFLYTGIENVSDATRDLVDEDFDLCSNVECDSFDSSNKKPTSVNHTTKRLNFFLGWPKSKEKKPARTDWIDDYCSELCDISRTSQPNQVSLRRQYSDISCLSHNRRTHPAVTVSPSPSTRKRFAAGLMHGVIQATPKLAVPARSLSSTLAGTPVSSPMSTGIDGVSCSKRKVPSTKLRQDSFNRKMLMNQYFCFGAQGVAVEDPISCKRESQNDNNVGSLVA
ncbi:Ankyrin repeat-containing protein [Cucurbita argyrosperma subsp. argyrosperma]|uniref:Protein phosphatase 1 regulatory subunit 12A-like n=1 Tax=Cucurbita moschata TaxID=3662 RepID=A0A6J1GJ87_CUCMO|nr:protein phosphatase 1 regulatory subunit 12A-like [Cucurbita moschata]KAG7020124.1 Ankyrin repeat-containing protein [Cucurbita argyrosperma subsp. argyrosperma]